MKKVLICGATGFIGKNITLGLSGNKNYEIHAVRYKRPAYKTSDNVKWHKADLRNPNSIDKLIKGMDIVIQAAATTSGSKDIVSKPYIHVTDNAVINSYMFRSSYAHKIKHFIFPSCTVMYPSSKKPTKESDYNGKIIDKYKGAGETKVYLEKIAKFYSMLSDTKFTIIRHSNIYGPHDKYDLEKSHVFGATITKVMKATDTLEVWGTGKEIRDFLHADDLVDFIKTAIRKQKSQYEIYNCGSGSPITVRELCEKIIKLSGKDIKIQFNKAKPSIPFNMFLNTAKAKKELGWSPKTKIDKGIIKTLKWWKNNVKE
jgi:nucleoside-diphosphate-sugar epimerase|tara:strand:+ start:2866 stop:3810 length:945 start_codon:yes stop_codon:yes gene_type:complete